MCTLGVAVTRTPSKAWLAGRLVDTDARQKIGAAASTVRPADLVPGTPFVAAECAELQLAVPIAKRATHTIPGSRELCRESSHARPIRQMLVLND